MRASSVLKRAGRSLLMSSVIAPVLLAGCAFLFGRDTYLIKGVRFAPYASDHPVGLYYTSEGIPGLEYWRPYLTAGVPDWVTSGQCDTIGYTWVSAKRKYLDQYDSRKTRAMVQEGITQFRERARKHGADAVIDIRFSGTYIATTSWSTGHTESSPVSEDLRGTLVRHR